MRIKTPLGEYPFEFARLERRDGGLAVIGTVAGFESVVFLNRDEVLRAAGLLAAPVALGAVLGLLAGRTRP